MKPFTIGYAQKSAKELFETLERIGVRKVLDVRLKNTSGCTCLYTLKRDFPFLLSLIGIGYEHKITERSCFILRKRKRSNAPSSGGEMKHGFRRMK